MLLNEKKAIPINIAEMRFIEFFQYHPIRLFLRGRRFILNYFCHSLVIIPSPITLSIRYTIPDDAPFPVFLSKVYQKIMPSPQVFPIHISL